MKRKRYTEEQIISIIKQHEGGRTMVDLAREYGVAQNTLYRWKAKFGGMEVSEAKRLPFYARELPAVPSSLIKRPIRGQCQFGDSDNNSQITRQSRTLLPDMR